MKTCRLLICERSSRWAIAWRRKLSAHVADLCETRSLRGLWQEVKSSPESVVFLEIADADQIQPAAAWVYEARRAFPQLAVIAGLASDLDAARDTLRELGIEATVSSTATMTNVVNLARTHLERYDSSATDETIWDRLPWTEYSQVKRGTSAASPG